MFYVRSVLFSNYLVEKYILKFTGNIEFAFSLNSEALASRFEDNRDDMFHDFDAFIGMRIREACNEG